MNIKTYSDSPEKKFVDKFLEDLYVDGLTTGQR